jgi:hypothetical protein
MKSSILLNAATAFAALFVPVVAAHAKSASAPPVDPTRIIIECEEMQGVEQNKFGPGPKWQVGRWGYDLYQNMIFGGVWSSRLRNAMADEKSTPAEATTTINVPADGTYKVWAKYECPPNFNYAFGIRIQNADGESTLFDKTYGLINAQKHYSFNDKPMSGNLYWSWGMDHDAAEGYNVALKKGVYKLTLLKADNPAPAGARSIDAIMLTTDLSDVSAPRFPRYPLLDELRRANHVYFRFRNKSNQPIKVGWNHWGHRPPDYYYATYRDLVKFYDANGNPLTAPETNRGNWEEPIAPGAVSVWHDFGPTMNTESSTPFVMKAVKSASDIRDLTSITLWGNSLPFGVDIALAPDAKKILKSFDLSAGESELTFIVQPDLTRKAGVEYSRKVADIYRDVIRQLNASPRLGPIPKKMKIFAHTSQAGYSGIGKDSSLTWDFEVNQAFRQALGINTLPIFDPDPAPEAKAITDAVIKWSATRGGIIAKSYRTQFTSGPKEMAPLTDKILGSGMAPYFTHHSYGDEIGLPSIDANDATQVEKFRAYLRAQGETPQTLGVESWEQVKPLTSLSSTVAVQIGVLPKGASEEAAPAKLKHLYWHSTLYNLHYGLEEFAHKTKQLQSALGPDARATANLGGMHPFYWMSQDSFIDAFKYGALNLAWSEDYDYCQPEASRLVADFEVSYLRKGASYHDDPIQFYVMPHWPGNTPQHLLQNTVTAWGNNVKDIDWFNIAPDGFVTENYVAYRGGLPMWKTIRNVSGIAGLIEDDLVPARPVGTPIAMILSRSSDVWETQGKWQSAVKPGSIASNVSQEERKAIWYALRHAGYRVDFVTEDDIKDGLLKNYKVAYLCGQNFDHNAVPNLKSWVQGGGVLYATAGAARKNEFDEPSDALDEVLGRGTQVSYDRYRGPLRAKLELIWQKPKDQIQSGTSTLDALCSLEKFTAREGAQVLGRYKSDGSPAFVKNQFGKGVAYYIGTLPGQAYLQPAIPVRPMGKGGDNSNMSHFEPINFNAHARDLILRAVTENNILPDVAANHRNVVMNRLASNRSTVVTAVNLALQHDGVLKNVQLKIRNVPRKPRKVWTPFYQKGVRFSSAGNDMVVTLPRLQEADVVVLEY